MQTKSGEFFNRPGGGNTAIFAPDGQKISTTNLAPDEEGLVYADLDFDRILYCKAMLDTCGHYSRPDLLWLGVDYQDKNHVRPKMEKGSEQ